MDGFRIETDRPDVGIYPAGTGLSRRTIADFELVWMIHGSGRFAVEADEPWSLKPGQLLLVTPGLSHAFEWDPRVTSRHGYVHFELRPATAGPRVPLLRAMPDSEPAGAICRYLLRAGASVDPRHRTTAQSAVAFLVHWLTEGTDAAADPVQPTAPSLVAVIRFVRRTWSSMPLRRVTVDDLARAGGISSAHVSRLFTATYGIGPATLLERARLVRAEQLLTRSDLTVESVAQACGFADASHFTHRFVATHDCSPGRYRREPDARIDARVSDGLAAFVRAIWK